MTSTVITPAIDRSTPTPKQIVAALDQFIVGQGKAKRAVAIALRNRFRRNNVREDLRGRNHTEEHPDDRARPASVKPRSRAAWPASSALRS